MHFLTRHPTYAHFLEIPTCVCVCVCVSQYRQTLCTIHCGYCSPFGEEMCVFFSRPEELLPPGDSNLSPAGKTNFSVFAISINKRKKTYSHEQC